MPQKDPILDLRIVKTRKFSIFQWELCTWWEIITGRTRRGKINLPLSQAEQQDMVVHYCDLAQQEQRLFGLLEQQSTNEGQEELAQNLFECRGNVKALRPCAEHILARDVQHAFQEEGIFNPWNIGSIFFPPLLFRLERPPYLLVVAYRDRMERKAMLLLKQPLAPDEIERIEHSIEASGYSAIVTPVGGFGTYPCLVNPGSLLKTINTIAHEWVHNYLTLRPLGIRYAWWIFTKQGNQDIISLNETVAQIAGDEIGNKVLAACYPSHIPPFAPPLVSSVARVKPLQEELGATYHLIEQHLAQGNIEIAEQMMEEYAAKLRGQGYAIRKMNQALLAFYGVYAATPAFQDARGSIGEKLLTLRENSPSLKAFLSDVSGVTTIAQLDVLLARQRPGDI